MYLGIAGLDIIAIAKYLCHTQDDCQGVLYKGFGDDGWMESKMLSQDGS